MRSSVEFCRETARGTASPGSGQMNIQLPYEARPGTATVTFGALPKDSTSPLDLAIQ